jgi:hypothetical protein
MAGRIILCWVCEEQPAKEYSGGHPICYGCLEHFTPPQPHYPEYHTADVAHDLRYGASGD